MIVKTKTKKQNPFRIQKMSQETGLAVQEIMRILSAKNGGLGAKVSGKKITHQSLQEAKNFCETFSLENKGTKEEYAEYVKALEDWEHFALIKVEKACTQSIMIEVLELCPKDGEAERRLVKKLAFNYGFNGVLENIN